MEKIRRISFRRDGPLLHERCIREQFLGFIHNLCGEDADRIWNGENAGNGPGDLYIDCYCDDEQWEKISEAVRNEYWWGYDAWFLKDVEDE